MYICIQQFAFLYTFLIGFYTVFNCIYSKVCNMIVLSAPFLHHCLEGGKEGGSFGVFANAKNNQLPEISRDINVRLSH